jgi:hypothetical protein
MLKEQVYYAELDAENRAPVQFNNKEYPFKPTGNGTGMNALAIELRRHLKRQGFPSWIILNRNLEFVDGFNGFLSAKDLIKLLGSLPNYS